MRTDRRTDMTWLTMGFCTCFAKAPKNGKKKIRPRKGLFPVYNTNLFIKISFTYWIQPIRYPSRFTWGRGSQSPKRQDFSRCQFFVGQRRWQRTVRCVQLYLTLVIIAATNYVHFSRLRAERPSNESQTSGRSTDFCLPYSVKTSFQTHRGAY